ncbi:hypothetical protein Leryth_005015, partial [Lithospermum erythrorhizon]
MLRLRMEGVYFCLDQDFVLFTGHSISSSSLYAISLSKMKERKTKYRTSVFKGIIEKDKNKTFVKYCT